MDEPTASLDFGNRIRVLDCVRQLAGRGLAVIMSTHEIADRVAVIAGGRIIGYGPPAGTVTEEILSSAYGVDVAIEATPFGRRVVVPWSAP